MPKRATTVQQGAAGPAGPRGASGPQGPQGPPLTKAHILAAVDDQFTEIRRQLAEQLTRTGQIQVQLDEQQRDSVDLQRQLTQVHILLKKLVTAQP